MRINSFIRNTQATALMEFAIVFPVIFVLIIGSVEMSRLQIIKGRVDRMAFVLGDIVSRYTEATNPPQAGQITETELNNTIRQRFDRLMAPYDSSGKRMVIITSVMNQPNATNTGYERIILWQYSAGGYRKGSITSIVNGFSPPSGQKIYASTNIAATNTPATFSGNARIASLVNSMLPNENILVLEAYYYYTPLFFNILEPFGVTAMNERPLNSISILRPRNSNGYQRYLPNNVPAPL